MADITVYITSDLTSSERKVSPQWTVDYFKQRMELITGIAPQFQTIHHYAISNSNDYKIVTNGQYVAEWNLAPFCRLHIVDENPDSEVGQLADENPQEYKMTEEEYAARSNTVLQWKAQNQLGRFNPEYEQEKQRKLQLEEEAAAKMTVGSRCRVINIGGERRGIIRFVGKIKELDEGEGIWVGLEFDEPVGRNNGSIGGLKVFECRDKHGSFVKAQKVEVGDFPEETFSDEEL